MIITVKILRGQECSIEVTTSSSVSFVKQLIARELQVPVDQQRLVFKGKTLADSQCLGDYDIVDGTKLHLVVRKEEDESATSEGTALWTELEKFVTKHFKKEDAVKVLECYRKGFNGSIDSLSLDDIERLAQAELQKNCNQASSSTS